jgi:hypothetical protein
MNKAAGEFADILSPKQNFRAEAANREQQYIDEMKARRLGQVRIMEQQANQAVTRAQAMGDALAVKKAFNEADKHRQLASSIQSTLGDWYKREDQRLENHQKHLDELDLVAAKARAEYGIGGKISPQVKAQIDTLQNASRARLQQIRAQQTQVNGNYDLSSAQKDQKLSELNQAYQDEISKEIQMENQLVGVGQAPAGPEKDPNAFTQTEIGGAARGLINHVLSTGAYQPRDVINALDDAFKNPDLLKSAGINPGTQAAEKFKEMAYSMARKDLVPKIAPQIARIEEVKRQIARNEYIQKAVIFTPAEKAKAAERLQGFAKELAQRYRFLESMGFSRAEGSPTERYFAPPQTSIIQ